MAVQLNGNMRRFQGMTSEEIDNFSLQEYVEYEYARMERNMWSVVHEVQKGVDDAPVLSEYITAYTLQKTDSLLFFNEENLASYQKCNSDASRNNVPGSAYIQKICMFQKSQQTYGELFTEYVKVAWSTLMGFCVTTAHLILGLDLQFPGYLSQFQIIQIYRTIYQFGKPCSQTYKVNQDLSMTTSLVSRLLVYIRKEALTWKTMKLVRILYQTMLLKKI